jgi:hypothetical protein
VPDQKQGPGQFTLKQKYMPDVLADDLVFPITDPSGIPTPEESQDILSVVDELRSQKANLARQQTWINRGRGAAVLTGATAGSLAFAPHPVGMVLGGAGGALYSGLTYDTSVEGLRELGVLDKEGPGIQRKMTRQALDDAVKDAVLEGVVSFGVLGTGRFGKWALRKGLGVTERSQVLRELAKRYNIDFGVLPISESRLVSSIPTVLGRVPLLGGPIRKRLAAQRKQVEALGVNLRSEVGPVVTLADDLGVNMYKVSQRIFDGDAAYIDGLWRQAYELGGNQVYQPTDITKSVAADIWYRYRGPGAQIPLTPVTKAAQKKGKAAVVAHPQTQPLQEHMKQVSSEVLDLCEEIMRMPDYITANQHRTMQKRINKILNTANKDKNADEFGLAAELKKTFEGWDRAKGPEELVKAFQDARKIHMNHVEFYHNPTTDKFRLADSNIFGAGNMEPGSITRGQIFDQVYMSGSAEDMVNLRRMVGPDVYRMYARAHMDRIFQGAVKPKKTGGLARMFQPEEASYLDVSKIKMRMGLDSPGSTRWNMTKTMLDLAGGGVKMKDFEHFMTLAERTLAIEIPDAATLVARRTILSGLKGGLAAVTAAGGVTAGFGPHVGIPATVATVLLFRGAGHLISNPKVLKAATEAITPGQHNRRAAIARLVRMVPELRDHVDERVTQGDVHALQRGTGP